MAVGEDSHDGFPPVAHEAAHPLLGGGLTGFVAIGAYQRWTVADREHHADLGVGEIDGVGVYRLGLLRFPVFFQSKKYKGSVDPHDVRDFRGAMQRRGDHGLLITTGRFTAQAQEEAVRPGATAIDLVDGNRLCDLLQKYELGVSTEQVVVERVTASAEFFADL